MKNIWEEYSDHVESFDLPKEKWHQVLHEGHCSYCPPEERRFVTPELIENTTIVGGPSEIAEKIRMAEAGGLSEVSLLPSLEHIRETATDFAKEVFPLI